MQAGFTVAWRSPREATDDRKPSATFHHVQLCLLRVAAADARRSAILDAIGRSLLSHLPFNEERWRPRT